MKEEREKTASLQEKRRKTKSFEKKTIHLSAQRSCSKAILQRSDLLQNLK